MIRTGVDLIEIARVRRAVERWGQRFLRRVFTADELRDCGGRIVRYSSLAARWAAKEAAAKALGVGLRGMPGRSQPGSANHPADLASLVAHHAARLIHRPSAGVAWTEIEVVRGNDGQPDLLLHGSARRIALALGLNEFALSLSHTRDYAVASVVVYGEDGEIEEVVG